MTKLQDTCRKMSGEILEESGLAIDPTIILSIILAIKKCIDDRKKLRAAAARPKEKQVDRMHRQARKQLRRKTDLRGRDLWKAADTVMSKVLDRASEASPSELDEAYGEIQNS